MKGIAVFLALAAGLLIAPVAMAQSSLGLKAVGASVGYVSPENLDGTLGLGVYTDFGTLAPHFGLEARVDYWQWSDEAYYTKATMTDVTLGVRGKYYFPVMNPRVRPFAGTGLGIHMLHAEVTSTDPGFPEMKVEDSTSKLGVDLGGGVTTAIGLRTDLTGELWYGIVSDMSQFSMKVGISYKL